MMIRTLVAGLGPVLLCLAACGDRGVPCKKLCTRARSCRTEIGATLVSRLPSRSPALRQARREIRKDLLPALLDTCLERCEKLRRSTWWQTQLKPCVEKTDCQSFATCFTPALEP